MDFTEIKELRHLMKNTLSSNNTAATSTLPISMKYLKEEPIQRIFAFSPKYKHSMDEGSFDNDISDEEKVSQESFSLNSGYSGEYRGSKASHQERRKKRIAQRRSLCFLPPDEHSIKAFALRIILEIVAEILDEKMDDMHKYTNATVDMFPRAIPAETLGISEMTKLMTTAPEPRSKSGSYLFRPIKPKNPDSECLEVFLFESGKCINICVQKNETIEQIIKQIIYVCKANKVFCEEIIFPHDSPLGYDLRLVDDGLPIFDMPPLKRNVQFCECGLDSVAICINKEYEPPGTFRIKSRKEANDIHMNKIVSMQNKILIRVHLYIQGDNSNLAITTEASQTLRSIFERISHKRKLISIPHYYQFLPYHPELNTEYSATRLLNYMDECNLNALDMNLPIKDLKCKELVLTEKIFVDSPSNKRKQLSVATESYVQPRVIQAKLDQALFTSPTNYSDAEEDDILLNDFSATKYKEYEVHKTNEFGIRQARILALDRDYIYNEKPQNKNLYFGSFLPSVYKQIATTKKSMVKIDSIIKVERDSSFPRNFLIQYRAESGQKENLDYEASTIREAVEIMSRIKYIREMNKKERNSHIKAIQPAVSTPKV